MGGKYNFYKFIGWSLIIEGAIWSGYKFYSLLSRQSYLTFLKFFRPEFWLSILILSLFFLLGFYFIKIGKEKKNDSIIVRLISILTVPIIIIIAIVLYIQSAKVTGTGWDVLSRMLNVGIFIIYILPLFLVVLVTYWLYLYLKKRKNCFKKNKDKGVIK
jgi:membrane protein DedA with SNARE-associated domain